MMHTHDPIHLDAFVRMLALPDPGDLPKRAYTVRCEGDPNRRSTRLPGILMGWLQRRHLAVDPEEPIASTTRTFRRRVRPVNPGLRVVRLTATA
jgi:hypothetical protein